MLKILPHVVIRNATDSSISWDSHVSVDLTFADYLFA